MTREEKLCFKYGYEASRAGLQCAPCYDSEMNCMVSNSRSVSGNRRNQRNLSAWSLGYLHQRLEEGKPLDQSMFQSGMYAFLPALKDGTSETWASFAKECVATGQYVNFIPEADIEVAVSDWYDTLLASFALLKQNHGDTVAIAVCELGLQGLCLYPYKMDAAARMIKEGADYKQICRQMNDSMQDNAHLEFPKLSDILTKYVPVQSLLGQAQDSWQQSFTM